MVHSRALLIFLLFTCLVLPIPNSRTPILQKSMIPEDASVPLLWNRTYGGVEYDSGQDIIAVSSGGFAVTGITNHPDGHVLLLRTNADGECLWNRTYNVGIQGNSLIEVSSGGFAIATSDGWLIRADAYGDVIWNRTYAEEADDVQFSSMIETRAGDFAIIGYEPGQNYDLSFWLVDATGNLLNSRIFTGPGDNMDGSWGIDKGYDIIEHSTGGFVISASLDGQMALVRLDVLGNHLWRRILSDTYNGYATSLAETDHGELLVAGVVAGEGRVLRTDSQGAIIWQNSYGSIDYDLHMVIKHNEGFALAGTKNESLWISRVQNNGTVLWDRTLSSDYQISIAHSIIGYGETNLVITGSVTSLLSGELQTQVWIVAVSDTLMSTGNYIPSLISLVALVFISAYITIYETQRKKRLRLLS